MIFQNPLAGTGIEAPAWILALASVALATVRATIWVREDRRREAAPPAPARAADDDHRAEWRGGITAALQTLARDQRDLMEAMRAEFKDNRAVVAESIEVLRSVNTALVQVGVSLRQHDERAARAVEAIEEIRQGRGAGLRRDRQG